MFVFLTGLSYRSAPLAVRETLSIAGDRLPSALVTLERHAGRGVILSTCNRTEVYSVVRDAEHGSAAFDGFVTDELGVDPEYLRPHVYTLEQDAAVGHLFRVASSLDSQIIGESEILGQVRDAFGTASRAGMAGGALAHLFHSAIRTGKRARTETAIGRNALSVSRACVELARRSLGDLGSKRGLVVGVGEASRLAAQALRDAGLAELTVANRTRAHAEELADSLGGEAASLDDLPRLLAAADVVVTSTGAPDFVITHEQIEGAMAGRAHRPLLAVDIALPRDVEPSAASVPGVRLHTLDDLEAIAEANRREREAESAKVEAIVAEEVERFRSWWDARGVTPTIASIRHQAEAVRAAEVSRTLPKLNGLSPEQAARVDAMTKALVKKLLHGPTKSLRERRDESFTQSARELFGLDGG